MLLFFYYVINIPSMDHVVLKPRQIGFDLFKMYYILQLPFDTECFNVSKIVKMFFPSLSCWLSATTALHDSAVDVEWVVLVFASCRRAITEQ